MADEVAAGQVAQMPQQALESHARERIAAGFSLREVTNEYLLLKECILIDDQSRQLHSDELVLLNRGIDEAIARAAASFAALQAAGVNEHELLKQLDTHKRLLDAVLSNLPVGIALSEAPSGKFILNKALESIWAGQRPAGSVGGPRHYRRFHPDGREYGPEEVARRSSAARRRSARPRN